ncbi:MAG: hypothetical protein AMJ65_00130 [Phycisphaerae bacterium SG8_4]|nr:MAG: hypothetical protein AMJ65_00130 [Phycisphaerae bacterium SG8_4]
MVNARTTLLSTFVVSLYLCNCIFSAEKVVSHESAPAISVTFLDIEAGKAAIMDESLDSYFGQLQPMEMSAKTGSPITGDTLEDQRAECRTRYQAGVRQFADDEKQALRFCVEKLHRALSEKYPRFAETPWSFLKVSNTIMGGLPHTQAGHIVLCEGVCRRFASRYKTAPEKAVMSLASLLIHEQVHVFQRANQAMFDSLYTGIWGFIEAEEISGCPWLEKHHLVNPDGPDCCWVFPIGSAADRRYILPLLVFAEGEHLKRMPQDFRTIAVELVGGDGRFAPNLDADGRPAYQNLHEVSEYIEMFPTTGNIYHPNEACASVFTTLAMAEVRARQSGSRTTRKGRVPEPLRKWFSENLGPTPSLPSRLQVQ